MTSMKAMWAYRRTVREPKMTIRGCVRRTGIDLSSTRCCVTDVETQGGRREQTERRPLRVHKFASFGSVDTKEALTEQLKALIEREGYTRRACVNLWDVRSSHQYLLLPSRDHAELKSEARQRAASS